MKSPPDYITKHGLKMWFNEMMYDSGEGFFRSIMIGKDGRLFSSKKRNGHYVAFLPHVQEAYTTWKNLEAEKFLLNSTDTNSSPDEEPS